MIMHTLQFLALCVMIYGHSQQQYPRASHLKRRSTLSSPSNPNTVQVLIIGAGISGLEATRLLQKSGIKTVTLEARNRTGGRIWSRHSKDGHVVEMGARYIHGIRGSIPSGFLTNPISDLAQEAKIPTRAKEEREFLGSYAFNQSLSEIHSWYNKYLAFVREETRISSTNISFGDYANLFAQRNNFTEEQQAAFTVYLYFTIAAIQGTELDTIGAKVTFDITSLHYGKEHVFSDTGFTALTNYLAKDIVNIRLNRVVTKVTYNETFVEVFTSDGQIYRAEFVLITVPLGVLKSKQIEFSPSLPQWKLDTIDRIGFGKFEKVFLLWKQAWWNSSFYFVRPSSQPSELTYRGGSHQLNGKPMITCAFAGESAVRLVLIQNQSEVMDKILLDLQTMFPNITIPPPVETYTTNWSQDPFSLGSYSYISLEQEYEAAFYLSEPVDRRLLFAGEATSADAYGYTHSALLTARREVTRLLFDYGLLPEHNCTTAQSTRVTPSGIMVLIFFTVYSTNREP